MPFTQRHKLNIGDSTACDTNPTLSQINLCRTVKCDECDERCELGFHHFTALSVSNEIEKRCCPTIAGQPIRRYKGKNGEIIDATQKYHVFSCVDIECAKERINKLAQEIVKFCDHYKTR